MEIVYHVFEKLKEEGIMQKTMREELNLSGSIITRLKHNGYVTTETIGKICEFLQCTPNDIMEVVYDADQHKQRQIVDLQMKQAELQKKQVELEKQIAALKK